MPRTPIGERTVAQCAQKSSHHDKSQDMSQGPVFERLPDGLGWMKVNNFRACKHCRLSHIKCSIAITGGPCDHCRHRNGSCELPERREKREVPGWIFHPQAASTQVYKPVLPPPRVGPSTPSEDFDKVNFLIAPVNPDLLREKLEWLVSAPSRLRKRSSPMSWKDADEENFKRSRLTPELLEGCQHYSKTTPDAEQLCHMGSHSRQPDIPPEVGATTSASSGNWELQPSSRKRKQPRAGLNIPPKSHTGSQAHSTTFQVKLEPKFEDSLLADVLPDGRLALIPETDFLGTTQVTSCSTPEHLSTRDESPEPEMFSSCSARHRMSFPFILSPSPSDSPIGFSNLGAGFDARCDDWESRGITATSSESSPSTRSGTRSPSLAPDVPQSVVWSDCSRAHLGLAPPHVMSDKQQISPRSRPCQLPSLKHFFASPDCFLPPLRNL